MDLKFEIVVPLDVLGNCLFHSVFPWHKLYLSREKIIEVLEQEK